MNETENQSRIDKIENFMVFGQLPEESFDAEYLRLTKADIQEAQAHLEELPERDRRDLTLDTYRHFGCGYLPDWVLTKSRAEFICGKYVDDKTGKQKKLPPPSPRIIIPTPSMEHFNAVATPAARITMKKEFWKQHAGKKAELFGDPAALNADLIIVVEGEVDVMTIWQVSSGTIAAVGIMGCANWEKTLLPKLPDLQDKKLLLLLDADAKDKAEELHTKLLNRSCLAVTKFLYDALPTEEQNFFGIKVDANDIFNARGQEYLNTLLEKIIADAAPDFNAVAAQIQQQNIFMQEQHQPAATEKSLDVETFENVDRDEIQRILKDFVHAKNLDRDDWFKVGAILYRYGFTLEDWQEWSKDDSRYSLVTCATQWNSFKTAKEMKGKGYTVATLIQIAKKFGYKPSRKNSASRAEHNAQNTKSGESKSCEGYFEELKELQKPPVTEEKIAKIQAILRGLCKWAHDKNGNPTKIKADVYNYKLIFAHDPNLIKLFGRDDFRQETVFLKRAAWHSPNAPLKDSWDDSDDAELRLYLAENYAEMSNLQRTYDFIFRIARENSFNAVKKFFDSLPTWDGTPRMERLFVKFLGADDTEYTHAVTRHFLLGAIARAFHPGCDFQSVVVLQGPQGIGKSRVVRMLGGKHRVNPKGENWHIALRDQLDDSHAVDAMRKGWIVEIEEFAAGSRADVNAMKGVLSADDVTRRFAYDRRAKTVKSHWVFIATCNDDAPLRDQTGNRRFLPIKCRNKQSQIVEGMTPEYIRQVWAEALHEFNKLFATVDDFDADLLRLTPAIQAQAAVMAENITQDDGLTTEIKGYLNRLIPPQIIWKLLTRTERHKFFDAGNFTIKDADLTRRFKIFAGKRYDELLPDFEKACQPSDKYVEHFTEDKFGRSIWYYTFYGRDLREHICAAEIFNEAFGADNRKRMPRINEILSQLDGWHLGERLRNADPAYLDQKKVYYRD